MSTSDNLTTLTNLNYYDEVKDGVVIVKFSTIRCTRCKLLVDWYNDMQKKYPSIKLLSADLDSVYEFDECDTFKSVPAFVKYVDGKYVTTVASSDHDTISKLFE